MALGPKRENSIDDIDFLGGFGSGFSVFVGTMDPRRRIGGGAAESNDEARVDIIDSGLVTGGDVIFGELQKTAGPALNSAHGVTLKSNVDGSDSRSASSSSSKKILDGIELNLEKSGGEVAALREDVRVLMEMFGE